MNHDGHIQRKAAELCRENGEDYCTLPLHEQALWVKSAEMKIGGDLTARWTR